MTEKKNKQTKEWWMGVSWCCSLARTLTFHLVEDLHSEVRYDFLTEGHILSCSLHDTEKY
jgi:hypothetical protein